MSSRVAHFHFLFSMRSLSAFLVFITFFGTAPSAAAYMPGRMLGDAQAQSKYRQEEPASEDLDDTDALLDGVPGSGVTRGAFIQALMDDLYPQSAQQNCFQNLVAQKKPAFDLLFTDVTVTHPNAKAICVAFLNGIARGYRDGSFRPEQQITVAETSTLLAKAFVLYSYPPIYLQGETWYSPYTWSLAKNGYMPSSITRYEAMITTEQANEIFRRMRRSIVWPPEKKPLWPGTLPMVEGNAY